MPTAQNKNNFFSPVINGHRGIITQKQSPLRSSFDQQMIHIADF